MMGYPAQQYMFIERFNEWLRMRILKQDNENRESRENDTHVMWSIECNSKEAQAHTENDEREQIEPAAQICEQPADHRVLHSHVWH